MMWQIHSLPLVSFYMTGILKVLRMASGNVGVVSCLHNRRLADKRLSILDARRCIAYQLSRYHPPPLLCS